MRICMIVSQGDMSVTRSSHIEGFKLCFTKDNKLNSAGIAKFTILVKLCSFSFLCNHPYFSAWILKFTVILLFYIAMYTNRGGVICC